MPRRPQSVDRGEQLPIGEPIRSGSRPAGTLARAVDQRGQRRVQSALASSPAESAGVDLVGIRARCEAQDLARTLVDGVDVVATSRACAASGSQPGSRQGIGVGGQLGPAIVGRRPVGSLIRPAPPSAISTSTTVQARRFAQADRAR